ncbi:MAG: biotin/lipoyl-containing protein [Terracidiphilus sp.]
MKLQITIDGKAYEVEVEVLEDEESAPAPNFASHHAAHANNSHAAGAHAQDQSAAWDGEGRICRSPVMGLVIKVNARPGQAVEAGELVLVLEAMKMETNLTAPRAAIVKSVHVAVGDPVKLNQVLLELE